MDNIRRKIGLAKDIMECPLLDVITDNGHNNDWWSIVYDNEIDMGIVIEIVKVGIYIDLRTKFND